MSNGDSSLIVMGFTKQETVAEIIESLHYILDNANPLTAEQLVSDINKTHGIILYYQLRQLTPTTLLPIGVVTRFNVDPSAVTLSDGSDYINTKDNIVAFRYEDYELILITKGTK